MVEWLVAGTAALVLLQRLIELTVAARNRRRLLDKGAIEYGSRHYPLFFLLHGSWLIGWVSEALMGDLALSRWWILWLLLFFASQLLRGWSMISLGAYWNTRVLVLPGAGLVRQGPYNYLRHPNYIAVATELFAVPMIFGCWITAIVIAAVNAILLLAIRIPLEETALGKINAEPDEKGPR